MARVQMEMTNEAILRAYWIRKLREKRYTTVSEAAAAFNGTTSQWSNWERILVKPFASTMEELAKFLDVEVEDFSKEPENWKTEKARFIEDLRKRSRKNKDRYSLPDTPIPTSSAEQSQTTDIPEESADIFFDIASRINDARRKVKNGTMSQAIYDKNMKFLADMIELASNNT